VYRCSPRPENRRFLQRAVRYLTESGIKQFIDLGTGLPTQGNVHEIAQELPPRPNAVRLGVRLVAQGSAFRLVIRVQPL
jgi:hypothetical protein